MTSIYSVFDSVKQARRAIQRLLVPHERVRLSTSEPGIESAMEPTHRRSGRIVAAGAGIGAGLGLVGALLAFLVFDIGKVGSSDVDVMMLVVMTAAGLVLGVFVSGLLTAAVQAAEVTQADRAVRKGQSVVSVEAEDEEAERVGHSLTTAGGKKADGAPGAERSDRPDQKSMD
jgi:hypothetical protein